VFSEVLVRWAHSRGGGKRVDDLMADPGRWTFAVMEGCPARVLNFKTPKTTFPGQKRTFHSLGRRS